MFVEGLVGQTEDVLAPVVLDQVQVLEGGYHVLFANAGLLTYLTVQWEGRGGEREGEEEFICDRIWENPTFCIFHQN